MKMDPVVHFEMPARDKRRMMDFYGKAFGWETNMLGPEMNEYVVVMTSESDENGPKRAGMINGGFYQRTEDERTHQPSVVIAVGDINEAMERVKKAGGEIQGKPDNIPGVGMYVSFVDTEGNRVSMLEAERK